MAFPFVRMNQIYGNMNPPDMNGGLDTNSLLNQVFSMVSQEHDKQRQHELNMLGHKGQLSAVASNVGHPGGSQHNPQDMNVELGPNALDQAKIGINPDKGTLLGTDPKLAASLTFKRDSLDKNLDFKRDQLESTDKYHEGILDSRNELGHESNAIRANRADVYRYKAMHPDMVFKVSRGGNIFGLNPKTGESFDTGVDSGTLSDEDKINILGDQKIDQIMTHGDINKELQDTRGNQALAQIAARVTGQKDVNVSKPVKPETATQTRVRQNMSAHELVNKHPELARYVVFNGDGTFTVSKNAPSDISNKINTVLYPDKMADTTSKTTTAPPKSMTPPKAPAGWTYVRKPDNSGWTAVADKGGK